MYQTIFPSVKTQFTSFIYVLNAIEPGGVYITCLPQSREKFHRDPRIGLETNEIHAKVEKAQDVMDSILDNVSLIATNSDDIEAEVKEAVPNCTRGMKRAAAQTAARAPPPPH